MIYLKKLETGEIIIWESFGSFFDSWVELTQNEIDVYELEKAKSSKISVIKTSRDIFLNSNITVSTGTYKGTQTATNLFCNAVNGRTTAQYPLKWRLSDDVTWVSLSKDEAYELYDAFEAKEFSGYTQETNFIIQVNNATTLEEVNSIVIEFK